MRLTLAHVHLDIDTVKTGHGATCHFEGEFLRLYSCGFVQTQWDAHTRPLVADSGCGSKSKTVTSVR